MDVGAPRAASLALGAEECQQEDGVPTYQYACTQCGHQLEAVQSFSDAALTECPRCGGRLRKVFTAVGVVFKGSGFYRTDSRSGAAAKADAASKADAPSGGSGDAKPGKPAATTAGGKKKAASSSTATSAA